MENMKKKKEQKYLILWLCISVFFHLFLTSLGFLALKIMQKKSKVLKKSLNPKKKSKKLSQINQQQRQISRRIAGSPLVFYGADQEAVAKPVEKKQIKKSFKDQAKDIDTMKDEEPAIPSKKQSKIKPIDQTASKFKIVSKKHRPAEKAKKDSVEIQFAATADEPKKNKKKKFSLQDLKKGFMEHIRSGNDSFSREGNSSVDDAESLKRLSYVRQIGHMYQDAEKNCKKVHVLEKDHLKESRVCAVIDRSGKMVEIFIIKSSGNPLLDKYHLELVQSIGMLPPIPKYIKDNPFSINFIMDYQATHLSSNMSAVSRPKLEI